jgi:hypothetical protein
MNDIYSPNSRRNKENLGKKMTTIFGLPDGGAGITFADWPSHHNKDGTITVTFSAATLQAMLRLAQNAIISEKIESQVREDDDSTND